MAEAEVPYSWAGRQVRAAIVEESGYSDYGAPLPLTAVYRVGTLEAVNDLGIVGTLRYFEPEDEVEEAPPVSTFYPWSSVVWLRLAEEKGNGPPRKDGPVPIEVCDRGYAGFREATLSATR